MTLSNRYKLSRILLIVIIVVLAWAIIIYPLTFKYAAQQEAIHAATDSEVGTFMWEIMKMIISGWFTLFMLLVFLFSFISTIFFREFSYWRYIQLSILITSLSFIVLHMVIDRPSFVFRSLRLVILDPSSFSEPIELVFSK